MATDKGNQIRKAENEPAVVPNVAHEQGDPNRNFDPGLTKLREANEASGDQIQNSVAKPEINRKHLVDAQSVDCDLYLRDVGAEMTMERNKEQNVREQAGLLSDKLVETEALLRQTSTRLEQIEATTGWRLEQLYHAFTNRLFPYGTLRREAYRRTISRVIKALVPGRTAAAPSNIPPGSRLAPPSFGTASPAAVDEHLRSGTGTEIFIHCYSPQAGATCRRRHLIRGWTASLVRVLRVEILVDGEKLGEAIFWPPPPKDETEQPRSRGAYTSGFFYVWDTSLSMGGGRTLTIRAETDSGARTDLLIPVTVSDSTEDRTYERWIRSNEPSRHRLPSMSKEAKHFRYSPLISLVTPILGISEKLLRDVVASVQKQTYPNWELCLAADTQGNPELTGLLETLRRQDPRIKYVQTTENGGIADAANAAISLATGEFVAIMDSDGVLSPDALHWNIKLLQDHRDADLIYSDEDKLDQSGHRIDPFFKPDWSPDLLLSDNYIGHLLLVRRELLKEAGPLRSENEGTGNYDLILRLMERTGRIFHIPRILYHGRDGQSSGFPSMKANSQGYVNAKRALTDYLNRNKIAARVEPGCDLGRWQVRYEITENPKVAVIIPTGGRMELLEPCLESFFSLTNYTHYEILLVDNSKDRQVEQFAKSSASRNGVLRYLDYRDKKFNYSTLNNFAAGKTEAPLLLFLNDDVTIVHADWLGAMVEHGQRPKVGAVGAKLIYPSGNIQHAGVLMGIYECTSHAFKNLPANSLHYFAFPQMIRNCSAVTAACMLTRRAAFWEVGGLDEKNLAVAFQDVDYCLKLGKAGYRIVYTPLAWLIHHESVTKEEKIPNWREVRFLQKKWREVIARDPFYSPNLTRKAEDYSLRLE